MAKLIAIAKTAWGLLTGSRETVLLIAIASAAAALYAWGGFVGATDRLPRNRPADRHRERGGGALCLGRFRGGY